MNCLNEYVITIKTNMEDGSIEYEGIVKEVESLKEIIDQERKSKQMYCLRLLSRHSLFTILLALDIKGMLEFYRGMV